MSLFGPDRLLQTRNQTHRESNQHALGGRATTGPVGLPGLLPDRQNLLGATPW